MYHHKILKAEKAPSLRFEICLQDAQDTKPTQNNTHLDSINVIAMNTKTTPNSMCNEYILLLTKEEARE